MGKLSLHSVDDLLAARIRRLRMSTITRDDFLSTCSLTPREQAMLMKYRDLNTRATEYKRQGDLVRANELYCESFKIEPKYSSEVIWGWVKVLLLAKDWEGAKKVLEYHEMMMVAWMRLMRDEGNEQYFREIRMWGREPQFEFAFNPGKAIRENCGCDLASRAQTEGKIASYGGSGFWKCSYNLSEAEFRDFLTVFPRPIVV